MRFAHESDRPGTQPEQDIPRATTSALSTQMGTKTEQGRRWLSGRHRRASGTGDQALLVRTFVAVASRASSSESRFCALVRLLPPPDELAASPVHQAAMGSSRTRRQPEEHQAFRLSAWYDSDEAQAVRDAWAAVGIDLAGRQGCPGGSYPYSCTAICAVSHTNP
jgi:hypothetical protein